MRAHTHPHTHARARAGAHTHQHTHAGARAHTQIHTQDLVPDASTEQPHPASPGQVRGGWIERARYGGRVVRSYLCACGARPITLLHQRVERPGCLDGLIEQKISDQTVQVWPNSCQRGQRYEVQRGESYEVRPVETSSDLTSLLQYPTSEPTHALGPVLMIYACKALSADFYHHFIIRAKLEC